VTACGTSPLSWFVLLQCHRTLELEHIAKTHIREEDIVAEVLWVRGEHPDLIHIMSALGAFSSHKPRHD
jgi:hypothetical protein